MIRDVSGSSRGYVYWLPNYVNVGRWLRFRIHFWLTIPTNSDKDQVAEILLGKEFVT